VPTTADPSEEIAASTAGHYPVSLVIEDQPCLVVGGGPVAASKVRGLRIAGARVTVVAPSVVPVIERLAEQEPAVVVHRRTYRSGETAGYRLVITATGVADIDAAVARDATSRGIWVNSADDPANCSFILPSVHRDGRVTVAVSTGGASPALASWIRRRLARCCGRDMGALAELLGQARKRVQASGRPTNSVDWQGLLDGCLPGLVNVGRLEEARRLVELLVP
jgi:siroheme synthase-like protein